jgi:glycosyltransferase involved in cell wall biosynthesis
LKKKICFIINKPTVGGAELFLLKLIIQIQSEFDCYIIFLSSKGELLEDFKKVTKKVYFLEISANLISIAKSFNKLVNIIKDIKPDVVHSWLYISDIFGGVASYLCNVPKIIWSIRQSNLTYSQNKLHSFLLSRICGILSYLIPHKIISCSEIAKNVHIRDSFYKRSKILVIPNGYDLNYLVYDKSFRKEFRDELIIKESDTIIAIIGRYDIQKGFDNFVQIAENISKKIPHSKFLFIGPGCTNENNELISFIDRNNLTFNSYLLGPRNDIKKVLCSIDLLIIPSRGEAFPNVLGEAMSLGTLVVATNVGEIPIILHDIQKTYTPGSNQDMANEGIRLLQLAETEKEKLSTKLRNRIVERYEIESIIQSYMNTYHS